MSNSLGRHWIYRGSIQTTTPYDNSNYEIFTSRRHARSGSLCGTLDW